MRKKAFLNCLVLCLITAPYSFSQTKAERQQQYLEEVLQLNIKQRFRANTRRVSLQDSTWEDWLTRTGELPPDFQTMPSVPMLPDPLFSREDGKAITTKAEWRQQREWIKTQYQQWISGHVPPAPPV